MQLLFADPALMNNLGHHANACRHIAIEARKRGIPTAVLAYFEIEDALKEEFLAFPWFRSNTYGVYDHDPICAALNNFDIFSRVTYEDLDRLPSITRDTLIFFNSINPGQLDGLIRWGQDKPPEKRPTVVVEFGINAGVMPKQAEDGSTTLELVYPGDTRPIHLRHVAKKRLTAADQEWLYLSTFDAKASSIYEKLFDFPCHALPLSNGPITGCRDRTGKRPITVAFLGHQRLEKGFGMVPELAIRLLTMLPDIRILVHNGAPDFCVDLQKVLRTISSMEPRLILDERTADEILWGELLDQSDLVVCPYYRHHFISTYSALASEAIANAIPLVVPSRTTMEFLMQEFGFPGIIYDDPSDESNPEEVLRGILTAIQNFDLIASRAKLASRHWETLHGPQRLIDTMAAWHNARQS